MGKKYQLCLGEMSKSDDLRTFKIITEAQKRIFIQKKRMKLQVPVFMLFDNV